MSGPLPNIAQHPELECEAAVYFQAGKFVWGAEGFKWIGDTKGGAAAGAGAGRVSRAHCKSSGYESIGLDSESTSVDSYTGTLADTR